MTRDEKIKMARKVLGKHFTKKEVEEILRIRLLKDGDNSRSGQANGKARKT